MNLLRISGIALLGCALALSFLVSISLPYLTALDITRSRFNSTVQLNGTVNNIQELRLGIWAPCSYNPAGDRLCLNTGYSYAVRITNTVGNSTAVAMIHSRWTTGLAVHPAATILIFCAFVSSLFPRLKMMLVATLLSFLAALLTSIAFAIDIALFGFVKSELHDFDDAVTTKPGPGFWLTFVSLILLFLAGCAVCFGRRKMSGATPASSKPSSKTSFFSRLLRR